MPRRHLYGARLTARASQKTRSDFADGFLDRTERIVRDRIQNRKEVIVERSVDVDNPNDAGAGDRYQAPESRGCIARVSHGGGVRLSEFTSVR